MAELKYQELLQRPCCGDCFDPSDIAETAANHGHEWYFDMNDMLQGMKNLFAVGLRHTFEQQFVEYYRRELLLPGEVKDIKAIGDFERVVVPRVSEKLKKISGINFKEFNTWQTLNELRLVANVVKHAEGSSAGELKHSNPKLFQHPLSEELGYPPLPADKISSIFRPLYGEGIYITEDDFERYAKAVEGFWEKMAEEFEKVDQW